MPFTSEEVIAKLQAAGVQFKLHTHEAVMTVEAQEIALAGSTGTVIKNLFIKDKKHRLYIISAMPNTKVDLNVLSARLGTGKGGVRFAPEELLQEVLHVPAGSVTPLVVANPEAKDVVLFLDTHIQQAPGTVFVHPLVNTASLELTPADLVAGLKAVGREPVFVDLEADPKIDRDNPPDLAKYTVAPPAKPEPGTAPPAQAASPAIAPPSPAPTPAASQKAAGGKKAGKGAAGKGDAGTPAVLSVFEQHQQLTSVESITQKLLSTVSLAIQGPQAASFSTQLDPYTLQRLTADVESQLTILKNAAYAMGYTAGKGEVVAYAERRYA